MALADSGGLRAPGRPRPHNACVRHPGPDDRSGTQTACGASAGACSRLVRTTPQGAARHRQRGGVGKTDRRGHRAATGARRPPGRRDLGRSGPLASRIPSTSTWGRHLPRLRQRCSAQQVDARQRFEDHWAEIRDCCCRSSTGPGRVGSRPRSGRPARSDRAVCPDRDRIAVRVGRHRRGRRRLRPHRRDDPPLSLPDVLSWYMDRLFPASRRLPGVVAPVPSHCRSPADGRRRRVRRRSAALTRLDAVHRIPADPR